MRERLLGESRDGDLLPLLADRRDQRGKDQGSKASSGESSMTAMIRGGGPGTGTDDAKAASSSAS